MPFGVCVYTSEPLELELFIIMPLLLPPLPLVEISIPGGKPGNGTMGTMDATVIIGVAAAAAKASGVGRYKEGGGVLSAMLSTTDKTKAVRLNYQKACDTVNRNQTKAQIVAV